MSQPDRQESITEFAERAAAAGIRELWVSVGKDEQSALTVLHVSPRTDDRAKAAGIGTRSFYSEGDMLIPCDTQHTFAEAVMRSNMTEAQKIDWLYTTCREHEERLMNADATA